MTSIPFSFSNRTSERLDGVIEIGTAPVRAWAVFAHCFTCDKTSLAAVRVSRALASRGIGVLRFDFTGLGRSEGSFGAGLSHDATDIADAVAAMGASGRPVHLLIGHSFGGAAVLAVAGALPGVTAVAVIGAPFEAEHVLRHLDGQRPDESGPGSAPVNIGGRPFNLAPSFLSDIKSQNQGARIASLGKALLVLHSPVDTIVSINNASEIFAAAHHPKSFISLDQADHMLRRPVDADYAAACIAGWSSRFLTLAEPGSITVGNGVRVSETRVGRFQVLVETPTANFLADEPGDLGGLDSGPTPFELVSAGLGACTVMTCRLYAERKGWPLARTSVDVTHTGRAGGSRDSFKRRIAFEGDIDEIQRAKLLEIANKCPVHRTLNEGADVMTDLALIDPAELSVAGIGLRSAPSEVTDPGAQIESVETSA